MVTLIHGDDISSSRSKLVSILEAETNVTKINCKKQKLAEIADALQGDSLFDIKKTIVLENFSKIKPIDDLVNLILPLHSSQNTKIILWEIAELDKRLLTKLKVKEVFLYTFPKYFYQFLDSFLQKSGKSEAQLLKKLLLTSDPEQVFYSLIKRVRQLYIAKLGIERQFSETAKMSDWQLSKIRNQAASWEQGKLADTYIRLSDLEEKMKTSGLTMSLTAHLDFLLLSDLN